MKDSPPPTKRRRYDADLAGAHARVADYVGYYNHERLHARLDCQMPDHAHQQLFQLNALNCPA